ncbi:MAG: sugar ABC transporter substrate-binding protein [Chloroflexi bacterium]|nr:sugar ABC transporter substrate-binding protein [Chloroflexota bacterium]
MNNTTHLLMLLLLLLLVGCGNDDTAVSFMVFGEPAEFAAYEQLVAAFTERHPDIPIELQHIPSQGEYRQRLAAGFSAGMPPDVMLLNYRRFAAFAAQGGLEPIEPFMAQSDVLRANNFFPTAVSAFQFNGQLWCVPQNISSLVVYYNRDLFDAAGLKVPANDWTWDDFVQAGQALTIDVDGDGRIDQYGAGISPNIFRLAPFIWQNGGQLVDNPANPTRLTLDSPASIAALQWFVDLQIKEGIVPDAVAEAAEPAETRFLNGRLGMYFNSRRGTPTYRTIQNFAWDVVPLPRSQQMVGILHSDAYCMAAAAKNKKAAWTFIEFANSAEGQTIIAATGRTVPSLMSVAESPAFLDPALPPDNARIFIDTVPQLGRVPIMSGWPGIELTTSQEIERAFYGRASVAEAADTAVEQTQPFFADQ